MTDQSQTTPTGGATDQPQTPLTGDAIESYFLEMRKVLRQTQRRGTNTDKLASRAREVEELKNKPRPKSARLKSRGRLVDGTRTPAVESEQVSDDEGLGGCKFTLHDCINECRANNPQMVSSTQACCSKR